MHLTSQQVFSSTAHCAALATFSIKPTHSDIFYDTPVQVEIQIHTTDEIVNVYVHPLRAWIDLKKEFDPPFTKISLENAFDIAREYVIKKKLLPYDAPKLTYRILD